MVIHANTKEILPIQDEQGPFVSVSEIKPMSSSNDAAAEPRSAVRRFKILDATEAAAIMRMDARTLIRWARLGYVPAHPLGEGKRRLWRFIEDEILDWFEKRSQVQKRPPARSIDSAIRAPARKSA